MKPVPVQLLLVLIFCTVGCREGRSSSKSTLNEKSTTPLFSDVELLRNFRPLLKQLSTQRLNHQLSSEEYYARLAMLRHAIAQLKQADERLRIEKERGTNDPDILKFQDSSLDSKILQYDWMIRILDKLMRRDPERLISDRNESALASTVCTAASSAVPTNTVPTTSVRQKTDERSFTSTGGSPLAIYYKHQTERHLSKAQSYATSQPRPGGNPNSKAFSDEDGGKAFSNEDGGKAFSDEDGGKAFSNEDGGKAFSDEDGGKAFSDEDGGKAFSDEDGGKAFSNEDGGKAFSDEDGGKAFSDEDGGKAFSDEDGEEELEKTTHDRPEFSKHKTLASKNTEEKSDPERGNNASVLDLLLTLMLGILATQVCILTFLLLLKDKLIVTMTLKYGQIKFTEVQTT